MQKKRFNIHADFLFYLQTHSAVVYHCLDDILISVTRLVREFIVKHTAREQISLQSGTEPNHSNKIIHLLSFQKKAVFGKCLTNVVWYDSTLPTSAKKEGLLH